MLNPKLVPQPLMQTGERPPLQLEEQPPAVRFRVLYVFAHLLAVLIHIGWLKALGKLSDDRLGDLLREFCQRMGVLWIKLGQLFSMRADLASPGVRAQLARLLDSVRGFPGDVAARLVEHELAMPLDRVFSDFDRTPLAAASIAQVHRARLRQERVWVAVKIRRPGVQRIGERDLAFVRFLVACLEWLRYKPQGRWRDMLWELQEAMLEELDYRFEATNMRRMKKNLRPHGIYVPRVFSRYCTPGILVMEFIQGVPMSDYLQVARSNPDRLAAWREANDIVPARVARRLVHSLFRQTFEENLFHGDLHPGNIVLLRGSRIAFLDFGSLGSMERDFTRTVDLYIQAMGTRQYSKMVDLFFLFSPSLPPANLLECKAEMMRRLQAWDIRNRVPELPYNEKSFNSIQDELVVFAATCGVAPVWTFFRMTRAMTTMDASLRELTPEASFHRLVNSYYRRRVQRIRDQLATRLVREGNQNLHDWFALQDRLLDDTRFRGSIVRRAAQVFEKTTSKISLFFAGLFGNVANVLLALLLIGSLALLQQHGGNWIEALLPTFAAGLLRRLPGLDVQVWVVCLGVLTLSWQQFKVLSRRCRERDLGQG